MFKKNILCRLISTELGAVGYNSRLRFRAVLKRLIAGAACLFMFTFLDVPRAIVST